MAERIVVANPFQGQIPTVGATASPVDTYVKARVKKGGWQALEQSLQSFNQKALPALGRIEERAAKSEFAEGQKLWTETRINIGEAVKKGIIAEGESPYLLKGYRAANLNVLSANYASDLKNQLEKRKLYHNGDPAKIDAFITEFQATYADKNGFDNFNDVEIAEFFVPNSIKANAAFKDSWRQKHTAYMTTKIYEGFREKISAYTYSLVDPSLSKAQRTANAAGLQKFIQSQADQAEIDGLDRVKVGTAIADALRLSALETNSFAPLQFMNQIKLGTGPLAGSYEVRQKNQLARIQIQQNIDREQKRTQLRIEKEFDESRDNLSATASGYLPLLGSSDATERENAEAEILDTTTALRKLGDAKSISRAEALESLVFTRKEVFKKESVQDQTRYASQLIKITNEPDETERHKLIKEGLENGAFTTDAHINKALSLGKVAKGTSVWTALNEPSGPVARQWNNWEELYLGIPKAGRSTRRSFQLSQKQLQLSSAIRLELDEHLQSEINTITEAGGAFPSTDTIARLTAEKLDNLTQLYASEIKAQGDELVLQMQNDGEIPLNQPVTSTATTHVDPLARKNQSPNMIGQAWSWASGILWGNQDAPVIPTAPITSDIPD